MRMQNFGVTNKEHYGMFWYFLEWSISEPQTADKHREKKDVTPTRTLTPTVK